jgi:hypothetical protein
LSKHDKYGKVPDGSIPSSGEIDIIEARGHEKSINENVMGMHLGDHRVTER